LIEGGLGSANGLAFESGVGIESSAVSEFLPSISEIEDIRRLIGKAVEFFGDRSQPLPLDIIQIDELPKVDVGCSESDRRIQTAEHVAKKISA
jgi:hypothetical protein